MNSHDERLHVWTLRVAKFTLGVGAKHCPIIQYEPIGWAGGSATSHHCFKQKRNLVKILTVVLWAKENYHTSFLSRTSFWISFQLLPVQTQNKEEFRQSRYLRGKLIQGEIYQLITSFNLVLFDGCLLIEIMITKKPQNTHKKSTFIFPYNGEAP